jgi:GGDEF domain-containing protein
MFACEDLEEVDACLIAEKILSAFCVPHIIGRHALHISSNTGMSTFPNDGQDAAILIKNADTAMSHAKRSGRNNYKFLPRT